MRISYWSSGGCSSYLATVAFYERVLGMTGLRFKAADGVTRVALSFGQQKINLHLAGREFEPKAAHPLPGSADLCFLTGRPLEDVIAHLKACGTAIDRKSTRLNSSH